MTDIKSMTPDRTEELILTEEKKYFRAKQI